MCGFGDIPSLVMETQEAVYDAVAWDIETDGVSRSGLITVIGIHAPDFNISTVIRFVELQAETGQLCYRPDYKKLFTEHVYPLFEKARVLITLNGFGFDLPFMQTQFEIDDSVMQRWVCKTLDILEISRRTLARTFSLNMLLEANSFGVQKISSGLEAVHMAKEGRWAELAEYCLSDCILTYRVSTRSCIVIPEGYKYRSKNRQQILDANSVVVLSFKQFPGMTFEEKKLTEIEFLKS